MKNEGKEEGLSKYTVIDGQQRILSLTIFLVSIMFNLKKRNMMDDFGGTIKYMLHAAGQGRACSIRRPGPAQIEKGDPDGETDRRLPVVPYRKWKYCAGKSGMNKDGCENFSMGRRDVLRIKSGYGVQDCASEPFFVLQEMASSKAKSSRRRNCWSVCIRGYVCS